MKNYFLLLFLLCQFQLFAQRVVVYKDDTKIDIESTKSYTYSNYTEKVILDEKAYSDHAVFHEYEDSFHKLTNFKMTIYDRNGKKIKSFSKKDVSRYNFSESDSYGDSKAIVVDPDYKAFPFRIIVEHEIKANNGYLHISRWMPRSETLLEVKNASLSLSYPEDYNIYIISENTNPPTAETKDGIITKYWSESNLIPIGTDISWKQFYDEQPKVIISPVDFILDGHSGSYKSWNSFGKWVYDLNNDPFELTEETKQFLDGIDISDKKNAVDQVYKYMQSRTRYINISLGIGGLRALPTYEVDIKGYGDCKALTIYTRNMLNYINIASNPIIVNAGRKERDIKYNELRYQFNHIFLGVPLESDTVYLECTSQQSPFGYLGDFTDDRHVLWLDEENSHIIKTPRFDSQNNYLNMDLEITLNNHGNAWIELIRDQEGTFYEDILGLESISEHQREEYLHNYFDFKDYTIKNFSYDKAEDAPHYTSKFEISAINLARNAGSKLLIPINLLPSPDNYFIYNKYAEWAEIGREFALNDKIIINLPEESWMQSVPENTSFDNEFGSYECKIKNLENGQIEIRRKLIFHKGEYKKESFESFSEHMNKIKKADNTKLIIESKT